MELLEGIRQPNGLNCEMSSHECRNSKVPVIVPFGE